MMRPSVIGLCLFVPAAAIAGPMAGEGWISSGGQTSNETTGVMSTSVGGTAEATWDGPDPGPLALRDKETWFTMLSEVPGGDTAVSAKASAQAELLVRMEAGTASKDLILDQRAEVRGLGWKAEQWTGYQRTAGFGSPFWRSGRNLLEIGTSLEVPPLWGIGKRASGFWALRGRVGYAELAARSGSEWIDAHYDLQVDLACFGVMTRNADIRAIRFALRDFGMVLEKSGEQSRGVGVSSFDGNLFEIDWEIRDRFVIAASGGFALRSPIGPFVASGNNSIHYTTDPTVTPGYWLEARWNREDDAQFSLGAGSHSRIDPSGHAVDSGVRGAANARWPIADKHRLELELDVTHLSRKQLGMMAPADTLPVGTELNMARASGGYTVDLPKHLELSATAWAERSDRDNPRWTKSAPPGSAPVTRLGADLTITAAFGR